MDFTQISVSQGYKYKHLLVMIDTLTGWIVGFPTRTEKAEGVVKKKQTTTKKLLHVIILRFDLPMLLQSDNGASFTFKVTQEVSKAFRSDWIRSVAQSCPTLCDITYYLFCAWRPQSSGKVERANQFLKSAIKKITQETSLRWKENLPIALLHTIMPLRNRLVSVL